MPIGTQVVTRVEIVPSGGPKGIVGELIKTPADSTHAYRVRFPDGAEGNLRRHEFSLLKHVKSGPLGDRDRVLKGCRSRTIENPHLRGRTHLRIFFADRSERHDQLQLLRQSRPLADESHPGRHAELYLRRAREREEHRVVQCKRRVTRVPVRRPEPTLAGVRQSHRAKLRDGRCDHLQV